MIRPLAVNGARGGGKTDTQRWLNEARGPVKPGARLCEECGVELEAGIRCGCPDEPEVELRGVDWGSGDSRTVSTPVPRRDVIDEVGPVPASCYFSATPVLTLEAWQVRELEARGFRVEEMAWLLGVQIYRPKTLPFLVPARRGEPMKLEPAGKASDWRYRLP